MPSLTKKNRGRGKNCHNSSIKILSRPRSSPTNTMWSLVPTNQGYQSMRQEKEQENRLNPKLTNILRVQNKIINAEKNKKNIASKYDEHYENYDDEVPSINETWKTCEGDYTYPLRKSQTIKNLNDLVGGKKYKKKTHKHHKKKKPIPYKKKNIKYK